MMIVVKKKQLFVAICTWFEFVIGHMTFTLNFSPLGQNLKFLLLKHYICQKTDQIGTLDKCAYNFLYNYAIVTYSIYV